MTYNKLFLLCWWCLLVCRSGHCLLLRLRHRSFHHRRPLMCCPIRQYKGCYHKNCGDNRCHFPQKRPGATAPEDSLT